MRTKLNQQQMQFWALKMNSEEEIKSLDQQVQVVQKVLIVLQPFLLVTCVNVMCVDLL